MPNSPPSPLHPFGTHLAASWPPEDWKDLTVLIAISGGTDSVALLCGLEAVRLPGEGRLIAAHVNHKLRGAEADADQNFVEELCRSRNIPCEVAAAAINTAGGGRRGQGIEAAARKVRYAALEEMAGRLGARFVVTAHTADDQAETVLHRILRGTGIRGLAGMSRARRLGPATLLRPLLGVRRAELTAYLHDLGQPFRTDASNRDVRFTRNRIRAELLPLLAASYNRSIADALLQLGRLAGESQALIDEIVERTVEQCVQFAATGNVLLDATSLAAQPRHLVREVMLCIWRRQGWPLVSMGFEEWNELASMIAPPKGQSPSDAIRRMFPGAILVEVRNGHMRLRRSE
jgi:tRNA(Ile)-lysidine synthase